MLPAVFLVFTVAPPTAAFDPPAPLWVRLLAVLLPFPLWLVMCWMVVDTGAEEFPSVLAGCVHDDERARFAVGSRWQVYEFTRNRQRVALTETHDDVLREGYNLHGLRIGSEGGCGTGRGSEIVARGFRSRRSPAGCLSS
ncbi:hypothetical protein [Streptomyces sp. NPDC056061]|uniref:hypothetical protein n=1 Tax=Streptomyces sp. NPDC056061 TaxID=3345700 RepID=UPI0035DF5204